MEQVDTVIIGAGVVGLAIAERFSQSGKEIVVIEKHDGFGRETSSRNSEVIHAGLYYPEVSLKADLCVRGRRMLYEFCDKHSVPCKKLGKIVIANTREEIEKINSIYEQGIKNGVENLKMLTQQEIAVLEPNVIGVEGLLSPETGIIDTHQLMKCLEQRAEANGVLVAYNCDVQEMHPDNGGYTLRILDADGEQMNIQAAQVINAAGLGSDAIAAMVGIDIDEAEYRLHPCKGEYFSISNRHKGKMSRLVYPAPTPISLGIHAVINLENALKLGPSAFYVDSLDYDVDAGNLSNFYESAVTYMPFIEKGDLQPDMSGIRPKLQGEGEEFRDFVISEESNRELPGFINCIGIESPGLTACLAIAEKVEQISLL